MEEWYIIIFVLLALRFETEILCHLKEHKRVLDKHGKPDDVPVGIKNMKEPLPHTPLSGMYNKSGGKVRLTFKLEVDQLWLGTKGMDINLFWFKYFSKLGENSNCQIKSWNKIVIKLLYKDLLQCILCFQSNLFLNWKEGMKYECKLFFCLWVDDKDLKITAYW